MEPITIKSPQPEPILSRDSDIYWELQDEYRRGQAEAEYDESRYQQ